MNDTLKTALINCLAATGAASVLFVIFMLVVG